MTADTMYTRTELLLGAESVARLKESRVIVFGAGGVGSFAIEALARAGTGHIAVVDFDTVNVTNINRQLIALNSTVGRYKTDVTAERLKDINPGICIETFCLRYDENTAETIDLTKYNYILDAIDSVPSKLLLIRNAKKLGIRIISCMGTGNKLDPSKFSIVPLSKTSVCPLSRIMRRHLKGEYDSLKVLYSSEEPVEHEGNTVASVSFVPSVAGLMLAGEIIKSICSDCL